MPRERDGVTIAVDARELGPKPTGVGRYLASLLERWAVLPEAHNHRFVLYTPRPLVLDALPPGDPRFTVRLVPGTGGTWWEQVDLPRAIRADEPPDVLFAPGYSAPLRARWPVVLTIHDLSFFARPEWFPRRGRLRRQWMTRLSARRARLVLTDSQFSRREIVRFLRVPDTKLRVILLGAPSPPLAPEPPPARGPVILFVGSLFNRRRLPDLIHTFEQVARRHGRARLEIVGDDRTYPPQPLGAIAAASGLGTRISIRSYVPDAELAALFLTAGVFVFLSEYEGFGLTPLEALAHGVPLVVLDTPIAREIYGDAARYVPLGDISGTAEVVLKLLMDEDARAAVVARAPATLARYSWDTAARATLAALSEAANR
jgi:glycosyltransferase involved in cell wall biosynthesis